MLGSYEPVCPRGRLAKVERPSGDVAETGGVSDMIRALGRVIAITQWAVRAPCSRRDQRAGHMRSEDASLPAAEFQQPHSAAGA